MCVCVLCGFEQNLKKVTFCPENLFMYVYVIYVYTL